MEIDQTLKEREIYEYVHCFHVAVDAIYTDDFKFKSTLLTLAEKQEIYGRKYIIYDKDVSHIYNIDYLVFSTSFVLYCVKKKKRKCKNRENCLSRWEFHKSTPKVYSQK